MSKDNHSYIRLHLAGDQNVLGQRFFDQIASSWRSECPTTTILSSDSLLESIDNQRQRQRSNSPGTCTTNDLSDSLRCARGVRRICSGDYGYLLELKLNVCV
ncbi:uncharacterized protein [Atheta coriaria]|uniref:uncharacterized protein n=1 Tax=Dalotia coriaria TaxID=877792 RepID=UPI0031F46ED6